MTTLNLNSHVLIWAYSNGFFPMPHPESQEIQWFRPDPRAIIPLDGFHCSRSLRRRINKGGYQVAFDCDFAGVISGCADREDTWINGEFKRAYTELHKLGVAHSVEIYHEDLLTGGVYGLALGGAFFAESKFHRKTDASKLALYHLVEHLNKQGFRLLEVQFLIPHLASLGAIEIDSESYQERLKEAIRLDTSFSCAAASRAT